MELCEGLESVGYGAFKGCYSLEFINLPSTVTSIEDATFPGCEALESIAIPSSVTSIGEYAFHSCISLESISIPPPVTSIGLGAFKGCKKLKEVTFQPPHQLRAIYRGAFQNCFALEVIKIPHTVTEISWHSFYFCKNLNIVDLCGGSPYVNLNAFGKCPKLDHGNIIANGKMDIDTFKRFAWADLSRRIGSLTYQRKAMIETKLNAIPNLIVVDGRVPQLMHDSLTKVHGLITYWELKESTTILELAVWNLSLDGEIGVETRQNIRKQCGRDMQIIMSGVLQFFDYNTGE